MRFTRRRAVSPIIATLLLIAIAVAAGIIVYVFTNSIAGSLTQGGGQQVSDQVSMDAYTFSATSSPTCVEGSGTTPGPCVQFVLRNTGSSSVTFGSLFFDSNLCQASGVTCTTAPYSTSASSSCAGATGALTNGVWVTGTTTQPVCTAGQYVELTIPISAATAGTSHEVKLVTTDGGTFIFSVIAGRSG